MIHHGCSHGFVKAFIIGFGFKTSAIDSSKVPSGLEAGENHPSCDISLYKTIGRSGNEQAVEKKSRCRGLFLSQIEIACAWEQGIESLSFGNRFFVSFIMG